MIAGQVCRRWWQKLCGGAHASPSDLYRDASSEVSSEDEKFSRFFGYPRDTGRFEAPRRLAAPGFFRTNALLLQWQRADWQFTDPRLKEWSARFIELARKRGIPLYVHCAYRNRAEQTKLLVAKRTKAAYPRSAHNIGEAVDIVHGVFHWEMSPDEWRYLFVLGQEALRLTNEGRPKAEKLELNWGGDDGTPQDKFRWDPAHWEIADYRTRIREVREGPPVRLTPRGILRMVAGTRA